MAISVADTFSGMASDSDLEKNTRSVFPNVHSVAKSERN